MDVPPLFAALLVRHVTLTLPAVVCVALTIIFVTEIFALATPVMANISVADAAGENAQVVTRKVRLCVHSSFTIVPP